MQTVGIDMQIMKYLNQNGPMILMFIEGAFWALWISYGLLMLFLSKQLPVGFLKNSLLSWQQKIGRIFLNVLFISGFIAWGVAGICGYQTTILLRGLLRIVAPLMIPQ